MTGPKVRTNLTEEIMNLFEDELQGSGMSNEEVARIAWDVVEEMRKVVKDCLREGDKHIAICNDCGAVLLESELKPLHDLCKRLLPGDIFPVGDCPHCGAFCHYVEP